jgi:hypothetical protein
VCVQRRLAAACLLVIHLIQGLIAIASLRQNANIVVARGQGINKINGNCALMMVLENKFAAGTSLGKSALNVI